jgi:hypothetical protein
MKKVIGAVVAGTLVAGMASADISFVLKNRVRPSVYTMSQTYANDGATTSKLWDFSYSSHNDILGVYAKGENCGADVEIALANGTSSYTGFEATSDGSSQSISMDGLYDGWMTFGKLKVSFGRFDSRFINRYNKTSVEGGLADSHYAKYGVSSAINRQQDIAANRTFLYDFNNATAIGGAKQPALIFDYTINADAAKVLLKGGFIATNFKGFTDDPADYTIKTNVKKGVSTQTAIYKDNKNYQGAGYVGEIDVTTDAANLQAILKVPTQHTLGFGLYADVKAVQNLNLAFGFTYGQSSEYDKVRATTGYSYTNGTNTPDTTITLGKGKEAKATAFAFDARAFYQINDPMKVGLVAKYSSLKVDGQNDDKAETALDLIGTFQYAVSDTLAAQFDAGLYLEDLDDADKAKNAEDYIMIRPAVKISASKNAAITAGLEYSMSINDKDAKDNNSADATKMTFAIPIVCRVAL